MAAFAVSINGRFSSVHRGDRALRYRSIGCRRLEEYFSALIIAQPGGLFLPYCERGEHIATRRRAFSGAAVCVALRYLHGGYTRDRRCS
jgi:hypothetical protein